jgi:hypothetical protein
MKKVLVFLGILLVVGTALQADLYIKSKMHSDAMSMMGRNIPARDTVSEQWMGDDVFASVMGDTTTIMDFKKNKFFMVYNGDKTYVEADLPLDMTKLMPAQMQQMAGMMKASVSVAANGQTKTIGQWNCHGYDATISMMGMDMKESLWATKDVSAAVLKYLKDAYPNVLKAQNMFFDEAAIKEFLKVDGLVVSTEINGAMAGQKTHSTMDVVEVGQKTPPAGLYTVPAGYTKSDTLSMKGMGPGR